MNACFFLFAYLNYRHIITISTHKNRFEPRIVITSELQGPYNEEVRGSEGRQGPKTQCLDARDAF